MFKKAIVGMLRKSAQVRAAGLMRVYMAAMKSNDFEKAAAMVPAITALYATGYAPLNFAATLMNLVKGGHVDLEYLKENPVYHKVRTEFFDYLMQFNGTAELNNYHYRPILHSIIIIEMILKLETQEVSFDDWEKGGEFPLRRKRVRLDRDNPDNDAMNWVIRQLEAGQPEFMNPDTGALSQTALSVGPYTALMRDSEEVVLAGTEHVLGRAFGGMSGYLLVKQRIFLVPNANQKIDRNRVIFALSTALHQADRMFAHAKNHERAARLCALETRERHIGHYCWNVLSAWSSLYASGVMTRLGDVAFWEGGHVFGTPTTLYPELRDNVENVHELADTDACFDLIERENLLLISMQNRYVHKELANRIVAHAMENVTPFGSELMALEGAGRLVVLLTIRTSRRIWSEQVDGYVHLINSLHVRYPDAIFYIDGATNENLEESTHRLIDLPKEMDAARSIISSVNKPKNVVNAVGICMADSIALSNVAAFFVAPAGSGMTKYKWITNKPGIAHANHSVLDETLGLSGPLRVWDHYREDIIPAKYVAKEDVENDTAARDPHSNYSINFKALEELTLAFAADLLAE